MRRRPRCRSCIVASIVGLMLTVVVSCRVNSGVAVPYLFMIAVSENWRACLAFGSLPALYVLYNFHFHFPESIKWLHWKENWTNVEGGGVNVLEDDKTITGSTGTVTANVKSLANGCCQRPNEQDTASLLASTSSWSPPSPHQHLELVVGILLAYVNNCVDASLFYGPEIIARSSRSYLHRDANIFGLLCSLVAVTSVLFAGRFVIARFSRRQVYLFCLAVVCGCFMVSAGIFASYSTDDFARDPAASRSIMIVFAVLNMFAAVGPSTLFVVILSELFQDNSYRARYMSYCTFAMSLISLLVNGSMLTLFETCGTAATFLAYGVTYVACLIFFWVYLPETKQRQLV